MVETYADSQRQLTQESIFTAFTRLLATKKFHEISVTEITRIAGVSRMAFYRNYANKEEIVTTYLDRLFQIFFEKISKDNVIDHYSIFYAYFEYIKANMEQITLFLTTELSDLVHEKFQTFVNKTQQLLFTHYPEDEFCPFVREYSAAGLFSLTKKWITDGCTGNIEKLALFLSQQSLN
ncbi:TetR/AcrR family transcriptional regulator [Listeria grayi]|uniref:Transcriptional regulator, TetR family n=2 Tax=Listeria grayi TaxID=1641 RepID=D7UUV7_LISGR|nr:TetR/AcrR family transcriptional regulator [Listeria grayi]EFI85033.1 transcriptional regulator, TetR family [Listeria grayi DSM 20601]STY44769.1 HTH-type dhaKLM operon transcriptional activator dhaS [Listeria grayi]